MELKANSFHYFAVESILLRNFQLTLHWERKKLGSIDSFELLMSLILPELAQALKFFRDFAFKYLSSPNMCTIYLSPILNPLDVSVFSLL